MIVPDRVRKCVVFIGYQMADGRQRLAGSGFFIGKDTGTDHATDGFLVTARHVIDGIRKLGITDIFVRGNTTSGATAWAKCEGAEWRFHPT
jgi:S1-C subfamily serine protease